MPIQCWLISFVACLGLSQQTTRRILVGRRIISVIVDSTEGEIPVEDLGEFIQFFFYIS